MNRLTDKQEIQKYLNIVYQHPRSAPKNFRNISHPELEIFLYLFNFSKELSQLRDNLGMSPKKFRKISHTKLEISLHLSDSVRK